MCSLMIGLVFGMALLLISMAATGAFSTRKPNLIIYSDSNRKLYDGSPLTDRGWDIEGELKDGHEAKAVFKGTRTEAGESENVIEITITDTMGMDVTADYNIEYQFGTLTVEPRRLLIIGETKGLKNGVLDASCYQISSSCDGLISGHREKISFTEGIADVVISNYEGKDCTKNYFIILQLDGNMFIPQNGDQNVPLFSVYSDISDKVYLKIGNYGDYLSGENWTSAPRYDKLIAEKYSASYLTSITLSVQKNNPAVSIQIQSLCGYYALPYYMLDGDYQIQTSDSMYSGDTANPYSVNYYRYPEDAKNLSTSLIDYERDYRKFVYANYLNLDDTSRNYMNGLIQKQGFSASDAKIVKKVASFIQTAATYNLDYPKSLETEENVAIAFLEEYKEGVCRHYAISATLLFRALGIPARYCVGAVAFTEAGEWTEVPAGWAHAWVEVYLDGIGWVFVEVTGGNIFEGSGGAGGNGDSGIGGNEEEDGGGNGEIEGDENESDKPEAGEDDERIKIKPVTVRALYDGKTHSAVNKVTGLEELEKQGFTYRVNVSGQSSQVGKTETVIESIHIYNRSGQDVTDQYKLKFEKGLIHIYYNAFTFTSNSVEKIYDGKPIETLPQITYNRTMLDRYNMTVEFELPEDMPVEVGSHLNRFVVKLYQNGQDVTDFYWVQYEFGKLNIKTQEITFKAQDAQKSYDGTELICHEYVITEGSLLAGHYVGDDIQYVGSQTSIGRSDNKITHISIYDENGNDVTKNYTISLLAGKLRVTRAK